jgi:predicted kinase
MKTLYLIRGLPGSGKSTLVQSLHNTRHFETDMYFIDKETGEYKWDGAKVRDAHNWCQSLVELAMTESPIVPIGYDIAVSNTFTRKWEMQPYIDLAEKYGWTVFVIHCENNFGNIHGVGVGTLDAMARRWEKYIDYSV